MSRFGKVGTGLAVGLLVGLLGPIMNAVATHSGSEPALAEVSSSAAVRRGAWAQWQPCEQDEHVLTCGRTNYVLYLWHETDGSVSGDQATQRLSRGSRGQAVAFVETCAPDGSCTRQKEWRGPVTTSGANLFVQDPGASAATFTGTLTGPDGECGFAAKWEPMDQPLPRSQEVQATPTARGAYGSAGADLVREARATIQTDCWSGLPEYGFGQNWIAGAAGVSGQLR